MTARTVEVESLSEGWMAACEVLLEAPHLEANHLFVRMRRPLPEDPTIRSIADEIAAGTESRQSVVAVRNTIFPAALAEDFTDPKELVSEYLEDYPVIRRLGSPQGTYFGRICEYPHPDGSSTPQLSQTIEKLIEAKEGSRWRARYQVNIYAEHKDREKKRGFFPCMGHLAFQLGHSPSGEVDQLDCAALYRYQDMILKGYGNFLGLAELQDYVARATGFAPGELSVLAGHAHLTLAKGQRALLQKAIPSVT